MRPVAHSAACSSVRPTRAGTVAGQRQIGTNVRLSGTVCACAPSKGLGWPADDGVSMTTKWREVTSIECQQDFDDLLDVCIDIAAERISENWGLHPVAVVNDLSGGQRVLAPQQPLGDGESHAAMHEQLVRDLRAVADDLRSYAIVSDATGEEASGTYLEVLLEHREYAMRILVPYLMPDATTFDLGPTKASVGQRLLWP